MLYRVYLLVGSNMGNREHIVAESGKRVAEYLLPSLPDALSQLRQLADDADISALMPMFVLSDVLETEPWGFQAETKFLNMAISVKTLLEPLQVLERCQQIESELGRVREEEGPRYDAEGRRIYHSRPIDIDLLYCEQAVAPGRWREVKMDHPRLQLPHPMLPQRDFARALMCNVIKKENNKLRGN